MAIRDIQLSDIADKMNLELNGKDFSVCALGFCNKPTNYESIISFINSKKYFNSLIKNTNVKAVFLSQDLIDEFFFELQNKVSYFVVENPEETFYNLHDILINNTDFYKDNDFKPIIGKNCIINKTAVIEKGVKIGNHVQIGHNSIIKKGSIVGNNVYIGNNTVISSEGFQLIKNNDGTNRIIKHMGGCKLGNDVFIGDNVTVCNSLFETTTSIGDNTKIDNLVHIAHNCVIGENCVLTAGVILSGSTTIKNNVWLAPNTTVSNRVVLNDNSFIGIGSVVVRNVAEGTKVFGNPAKLIL